MVGAEPTFEDPTVAVLAILLLQLETRVFFAVDRLWRGFLKALDPGLRDAGERRAPTRTLALPEAVLSFLRMTEPREIRFGAMNACREGGGCSFSRCWCCC